MWVLIIESDDYDSIQYYVDSTKLDIKGSILDKMLASIIKKKSFTQELYISFPEMREKYPNLTLFKESKPLTFTSSAIKRRLSKDQIVEKHVNFNISY